MTALIAHELCLADTGIPDPADSRPCLPFDVVRQQRGVYVWGRAKRVEKREIGFSTFFLDFARLCETLDPGRFYSPSSPYGGRFANDALEGDTHSYNGAYHVPGLQYPVFFSEDCYTTALPMHSMRRFMTEEEIFPKDYVNLLPYGAKNPAYEVNRHKYGFRYWRNLQVPETWHRYLDEYAQCEYWGRSVIMTRWTPKHWCTGSRPVPPIILKVRSSASGVDPDRERNGLGGGPKGI